MRSFSLWQLAMNENGIEYVLSRIYHRLTRTLIDNEIIIISRASLLQFRFL